MRGSVPIIPDRPPGGWSGWNNFLVKYPAGFDVIEIWRRGWSETAAYAVGSDPAMNVHGLWWRPIARGGEAIN